MSKYTHGGDAAKKFEAMLEEKEGNLKNLVEIMEDEECENPNLKPNLSQRVE